MFNPLTPAQVVAAIGSTARGIARSDETLSDYARGQLLSAYSCSRHITVEIDRYEGEIRAFADDVFGRLVVPQSQVHRVAKMAIGGPLGELHLGHEGGPQPVRTLVAGRLVATALRCRSGSSDESRDCGRC